MRETRAWVRYRYRFVKTAMDAAAGNETDFFGPRFRPLTTSGFLAPTATENDVEQIPMVPFVAISSIGPTPTVRAIGLSAVLAAWLAAAGAPAFARDLTGKPVVIDGNTIEIAGQPIRLFGVQAPGRDETCGSGDAAWPCGANAGFALSRIIGSNWVTCLEKRRTAGAVYSVCHAAGAAGPDINARMIADGWARAAGDAPPAYLAHERRARAQAKGVWGGAAARSGH